MPQTVGHLRWDHSIAPVAEVGVGTDVELVLPDASGNRFDDRVTAADIERLARSDLIPIGGPIRIKGARPGQTVIVTIRAVEPGPRGWTAIVPGLGLLADQFRAAAVVNSAIIDDRIEFMGAWPLPLRPSAGIMGLAPAASGRFPTFSARRSGGRLALCQLVAGSALYLPVEVEGGLLSAGEGLAASGVGLVCGTGVETRLRLTVRFSLSDRRIEAPQLVFQRSAWPLPLEMDYHAVVGVEADLRAAARTAVLRMIDRLTSRHGLTPEAAYMLIGVQGELRIASITEPDAQAVSLRLPLPDLDPPVRAGRAAGPKPKAPPPRRHRLDGIGDPAMRHSGWDRSRPPVLTVAPGEELAVTLPDRAGGRLKRDATAEQLGRINWQEPLPLVGPIRIDGARPGQTLTIEVLEAEAADWGWTAIVPGQGVLADQFLQPVFKVSAIGGGRVHFLARRELPLRPFAGAMGVAPAEAGCLRSELPRPGGGRLGLCQLVAGTTLHLPIAVPGALFSLGDGHAVQGDARVCGFGVQARVRLVLRFGLSDRTVSLPEYRVRAAERLVGRAAKYHATIGISASPLEATRIAVREMIEFLVRQFGLSAEEAYMLCSVQGALGMPYAADRRRVGVSLCLPLPGRKLLPLFPLLPWNEAVAGDLPDDDDRRRGGGDLPDGRPYHGSASKQVIVVEPGGAAGRGRALKPEPGAVERPALPLGLRGRESRFQVPSGNPAAASSPPDDNTDRQGHSDFAASGEPGSKAGAGSPQGGSGGGSGSGSGVRHDLTEIMTPYQAVTSVSPALRAALGPVAGRPSVGSRPFSPSSVSRLVGDLPVGSTFGGGGFRSTGRTPVDARTVIRTGGNDGGGGGESGGGGGYGNGNGNGNGNGGGTGGTGGGGREATSVNPQTVPEPTQRPGSGGGWGSGGGSGLVSSGLTSFRGWGAATGGKSGGDAVGQGGARAGALGGTAAAASGVGAAGGGVADNTAIGSISITS